MDYVPEDKVFQVKPDSVVKHMGGYDIGIPSGLTQSQDGEMLSVFSGFPLPRKGVIYSEAVVSNNHVKRTTLALFLPFLSKSALLPFLGFLFTPYKWKIELLERFLDNYIRLAWSFYTACVRIPVLEKQYYNNLSKALWDIVAVFLSELGVKKETASEVGKILATTLEYDDFYKLLILDPMQEFSRDEILMNPQRALDKFIRILKERSNTWNAEKQINENHGQTFHRIEHIVVVLKYLLYIPKVKRAFTKALQAVPFRYLQLDELERFWNLNRNEYDLQGMPFPKRFQEWEFRINQWRDVQTRNLNPVVEDSTVPSGSSVPTP